MKYKNFEIRQPTLIGNPPSEDYFKYNFEVVRWDAEHKHCFTIAFLRYNRKECAFKFESVGLRYLEYREKGLEQFLLKWCVLQTLIIESEEK